MRKFGVLFVVICLALCGVSAGVGEAYTYEAPVKATRLPRADAMEKGVNPTYIYDLINALEVANLETHSLMIAVDSDVIFETFWAPYTPDTPHIVHSLTKLFTNAAVGVAVSEGKITLDDKLVDWFPDRVPEDASDNLKEMTVRSLITMTSGHGRMISGSEWRPLETSWLDAFFAEPVPYAPGTHYQYCSGNAYALSAIVQEAMGMTAYDVLMNSGFGELGMANMTWDLSPEGICSGGNGVTITTEDMLKVGVLYMNRGDWFGTQILSEDWCDLAIGYEKAIDDQSSYAFHWTDKGDGNYTAGGSYGQLVILVPSLRMTIAVTAGTNGDSYPIIKEALLDPIAEDIAVGDALARKAGTMSLLENPVYTASPVAEKVSGVEMTAAENEDGVISLRLDVTDEYIDYVMTDDRGTHTIRNGVGSWIWGETTMTGNYMHHQYQNEIEGYTAYAEWLDEETLQLIWRYPGMAFVDTILMKIPEDGGSIAMTRYVNCNSSGLERPTITFAP